MATFPPATATDALRHGPSRTVWFVNTRVTFKLRKAESGSGLCVMHMAAARGDAPPWHVHHSEDEVFHVVRGSTRFRIGDRTQVAGPGETLLAPRGIPHGYRVESDTGEMLVISTGAFETVVTTFGRPPMHDGLPPIGSLAPREAAALAALCTANDIDLLGPPLAG